MSSQIHDAVIARLAAEFPDFHDASGDPSRTQQDRLPSYICSVSFSGSERVSMDDPDFFRDGEILLSMTVEFSKTTPRKQADAAIQDIADRARSAVLAGPKYLAGVLWDLTPSEASPDHDIGDKRVARADVSFDFRVLTQA